MAAFALHQQGELDKAEQAYRQLYMEQPHQVNLLNLYGVLLGQRGDYQAAQPLLARAYQLGPEVGSTISNYGYLLYHLKRYEEAEAVLAKGVELYPEDQGIKTNYALVISHTDDPLRAIPLYQQQIKAAGPNWGQAASRLILAYLKHGQKTEAEAVFQNLASLPDNHHGEFGLALHQLLGDKASLPHLLRLVANAPLDYKLTNQIALIYFSQKDFDEAYSWIRRARRIDPLAREAALNEATIVGERGDKSNSMTLLQDFLNREPNDVDAQLALAVHMVDDDRLSESEALIHKITELAPERADTYRQQAALLKAEGRYEEALVAMKEAVARAPDNEQYHISLALLYLVLGQFSAGWREYEWRWKLEKVSEFSDLILNQPERKWNGKDSLLESHIILMPEQGYGDFLHFSRCIDRMAQLAKKVSIPLGLAHERLIPLLEAGLPRNVTLAPHKSTIVEWQFHITFLDAVFLLRDETIGGNDDPQSGAPRGFLPPRAWPLSPKWQDFAKSFWQPFRKGPYNSWFVGLCTSGNPLHNNDKRRSIGLEDFLPIFNLFSDVHFVLLQKEIREEDKQQIATIPNLSWPMEDVTNFAQTAALMDECQLVISVDTSVAHLAATQGKLTYILLPFVPDWRWLAKGDTIHWYPKARLIRQTRPRDWDDVFQTLMLELKTMLPF